MPANFYRRIQAWIAQLVAHRIGTREFFNENMFRTFLHVKDNLLYNYFLFLCFAISLPVNYLLFISGICYRDNHNFFSLLKIKPSLTRIWTRNLYITNWAISPLKRLFWAVLKRSQNFHPSVRRPPSDNALHRLTPLWPTDQPTIKYIFSLLKNYSNYSKLFCKSTKNI